MNELGSSEWPRSALTGGVQPAILYQAELDQLYIPTKLQYLRRWRLNLEIRAASQCGRLSPSLFLGIAVLVMQHIGHLDLMRTISKHYIQIQLFTHE